MIRKLALFAALAFAAPASAESPGAGTVLASVNGTEITLGHLIVARASLPPEYQSLPDDMIFSGLLDQMIQQVAIEQSMTGKLTLQDTLALENERRAFVAGVLVTQLAAKALTEEAVQAAYAARYDAFTPQTEYRASHILVESLEQAQDLKAELDAGGDFAALAAQHSTDGSAQGGGDLGWFGLGKMVEPFETAVVAATVGKVTGPVQTEFGHHLILVTETRATARPTLEEVRAEIESALAQDAVLTHVEGLIAAANVVRPETPIDPALLRDTGLLTK